MPGNGYPMRLLLPGYEGNMNTKFLRRLYITDQPAMTFYETRNYSPLLPDGKAYRFYFVNEVKSFITKPSFGMSLKAPGYYEISGLAYSGSGTITKVLVSADGGKSWGKAAVEGPATPKAFTRFRMPWRWDGQPVTITSRAWDDSGAMQPLRADFVALRGETKEPVKSPYAFPNHHYNSLTAWGIDSRGRSSMSMLKPPRRALLALALAFALAPLRSPPTRRISASRSPRADIKAWNITILPDGTGLPAGSGTAAEGAKLFDTKGCSLCHGENARGGIANMLIGSPSLTAPGISANKTIANFWGQPTTLFDYIRRAMPWPTPHTLSDDEVYAICAYLFAGNKIIPQTSR